MDWRCDMFAKGKDGKSYERGYAKLWQGNFVDWLSLKAIGTASGCSTSVG